MKAANIHHPLWDQPLQVSADKIDDFPEQAANRSLTNEIVGTYKQ